MGFVGVWGFAGFTGFVGLMGVCWFSLVRGLETAGVWGKA